MHRDRGRLVELSAYGGKVLQQEQESCRGGESQCEDLASTPKIYSTRKVT